MKANELMIGDWVYEGNEHLIKVRQNYGKSIRYDERDYSHEVEESCLSPIPLTAEILEKNGIKKRGDGYVAFGCNGVKKWRVVLEDFKPDFDFWFITSFKRDLNVVGQIRYVHELQRALRCCGLWDLAENFKI